MDGINLPDDGADLDRGLTAEDVREEAGNQSAQPGASGHGSSDTTLHSGPGAPAQALVVVTQLVELAEVRLRGDDGRHGRDIEPEQPAACKK